MKTKNVFFFFAGTVFGFLVVALLFTLWKHAKMTKVTTLEAPMVLVSNEPTKNLHLLPAGTTLYFDQSYPEGFTRYKVYINIDRMPLPLRDLADATEIDPIEARALSKSELAKALRDYPLTRGDLEGILQSTHMTTQEIEEVFNEFLRNAK
ncbi:MAG: hypothetical protein ACJ8LG_14790 [Massilia sp.]